MQETIDFAGDPHIGVFARLFEDVAVVPPDAPSEFVEAVAERFGVEILKTTIQGSSIIGSLLAVLRKNINAGCVCGWGCGYGSSHSDHGHGSGKSGSSGHP